MKEVARFLYGSQNYGLDTPESDKDYKVILCPEFVDLYRYHKVCKDDLPCGLDPDHYSVMSVMQFHDLLMGGNPNCIEMLFSVETSSDKSFDQYLHSVRAMYESSYVAIVWDKFYSALKGLALNGIKRNGLNPKTVSRLFYFMFFAEQVVRDGFVIREDTWRNQKNVNYSVAMNIRGKEMSMDDMLNIADNVQAVLWGNEQRYAAMAKAWVNNNDGPVSKNVFERDALDRFMINYVFDKSRLDYSGPWR